MSVRLVASDLDGTLLRDDLSVSPRTRAALDAARAAGAHVVPVTARQPEGLREIAEDAGFEGWALCSNGALCVHLGTGERLFESAIAVEAQRALTAALDAALPGLLYASVRDGGEVFVAQREYVAIATFLDHKRDPATMTTGTLDEVMGEPSLKFIVRHPSLTPPEVMARARELALAGVEITHSNAPFVEVQPEGVTKATSLARLCAELGVDRSEVLAFGDAPNDVKMLAWAGRGVAVANACPEALAVADEVVGSNGDDGVADVLEALLA